MKALQHLLSRMHGQADAWEKQGDKRCFFQRCYGIMSSSMVRATDDGRFLDAAWVERLLLCFADYYYDASERYNQHRADTPAVWQYVHDASLSKPLHILQHILLGINAHINYGLPLALYDTLRLEWANFSESQRQSRRDNHETVNHIIAETIDEVQDNIVEPRAPSMQIVDRLMERTDVWQVAMQLTTAADAQQWEAIRQKQEARVLHRSRQLALEDVL